MTDTIPNVPRELLERAVRIPTKASVEENHAAIVDRGRAQAEIRALLSAPSPAGVDGLEVFITDCATCIDVVPAKTVTDARVVLAKDAQAIIDGLRGEVAAQRVKTCTALKERNDAREERDQQAQRIGELEGLLREVRDTYRAAIHWEDLRGTMKRIDAALSAGKDSVS